MSMLTGDPAVKVYGLTRPQLKPTIDSTRGEHVNYYTIDTIPSLKIIDMIERKDTYFQVT